jgi:hypothetical protein
MRARLASSVLVTALIRLAESQGGFAAVLARGERSAGSILIVLAKNGRKLRILERVLRSDDEYAWDDVMKQGTEEEGEFQAMVDRRRKFDPDLWVLELDIPSAERFAAEMNELS